MHISVVIPVFNEAPTITKIVSRVQAVDLETKIIIVDDGSTDETPAHLESIGRPLKTSGFCIMGKVVAKAAH